ncbi:hypothetical protein [Frigoriglobus tundricola]|uniref:SMI1/KNR4 family protein n=1 Tax=Frigoriglobus tundricola TaxID=2774151 RepID=A0A6M5YVH3_9BACT|nr:hypothetical protein [Frigoriglobus tundricola]QJW97301.1 hypothetical protein FTUN_4871 [Frigoriglobus tundricola]
MTEAEWLACADPTPMLEFLRGTVSERKLRLWACACSRERNKSGEPAFAEAIAVAERWADGVKPTDLGLCHDYFVCDESAWMAAYGGTAQQLARHTRSKAKSWKRVIHFCLATLRDIFGNPFRPVTVNPSWRTTTVLELANQMYESRDFSPMPILADALQDAGCDNDDILNHCRQPGEHVKGCWVVDLILGKS